MKTIKVYKTLYFLLDFYRKFKDFLKIIIGAADAGPLCLKKRKKKKEEKDN